MKQIHDNRDLGAFIPAVVDDLDLSVFAFRVYAHLVRLSAEGVSESMEEMAKSCGINYCEVGLSLSELANFSLIELKGMNNITLLPVGGRDDY